MYAMEYNEDAYAEFRKQQNPMTRQDYYSTGAARYSFAVEQAFIRKSRGEFSNIKIYPLVWRKNAIETQNGIIIRK